MNKHLNVAKAILTSSATCIIPCIRNLCNLFFGRFVFFSWTVEFESGFKIFDFKMDQFLEFRVILFGSVNFYFKFGFCDVGNRREIGFEKIQSSGSV